MVATKGQKYFFMRGTNPSQELPKHLWDTETNESIFGNDVINTDLQPPIGSGYCLSWCQMGPFSGCAAIFN